jgi:hypothetical protein
MKKGKEQKEKPKGIRKYRPRLRLSYNAIPAQNYDFFLEIPRARP